VSRANIAVVRRLLPAIQERDLDLLRELTDPDVEFRSFFAALLERGEYRGHEGLSQYVADLDDAFEVIIPEAVHLIDVGDLVVGVGSVRYRGRASGVEREEPTGWVFKFNRGLLVNFRAFREPESAFELVGLPR
jgi:ketosteroid isomerase-like protein